MKIQPWQLQQRRCQPLNIKERMTLSRIKVYHDRCDGNIYVSFSGGKDSTVLKHLVQRLYPNVRIMFINTGLEFPENVEFVKGLESCDIVRPKKSFLQCFDTYGYPVVSKEISSKIYDIRNTQSDYMRNKRLYGDVNGNGKMSEKWKFLINAPFKISAHCCKILKKAPAKAYEKKTQLHPIVATMADESRLREQQYLKNGCNSFEGGYMSTPMAFWTEKDVWDYIKKYNLQYSKIYDMGYSRTGCMFCMFGMQQEKVNRFDLMQQSHPKIWNYCMNKLNLKEIIEYVNNNGKVSENILDLF